MPMTLIDVVRRLRTDDQWIPEGLTEAEQLDACEAAYYGLSHHSRCAARHPGGDCTCLRGEVAAVLEAHGRDV